MKNWTPEGHLTDLALELLAAEESEAQELMALNRHLADCPACQAREAGWREFIHALESLPALEPSPSFDDGVIARVRLPAGAGRAAATSRLGRRLRTAALGAAATWAAAVIGGALWLAGRTELPAAALLARALDYAHDLAWDAVLKIGAALQISGLLDLWARTVETVPRTGVLTALAVMTAISALALWTLRRVVSYEPSRIDAHV